MALQLGALREAPIDAGATPEKANRAAEEPAGYEAWLAGIDVRMERIEGRINLLFAQLGILIAGVAALVIKAFA